VLTSSSVNFRDGRSSLAIHVQGLYRDTDPIPSCTQHPPVLRISTAQALPQSCKQPAHDNKSCNQHDVASTAGMHAREQSGCNPACVTNKRLSMQVTLFNSTNQDRPGWARRLQSTWHPPLPVITTFSNCGPCHMCQA